VPCEPAESQSACQTVTMCCDVLWCRPADNNKPATAITTTQGTTGGTTDQGFTTSLFGTTSGGGEAQTTCTSKCGLEGDVMSGAAVDHGPCGSGMYCQKNCCVGCQDVEEFEGLADYCRVQLVVNQNQYCTLPWFVQLCPASCSVCQALTMEAPTTEAPTTEAGRRLEHFAKGDLGPSDIFSVLV